MNDDPLSELQIQMLRDETFHIDGWHTRRGKEAAADLERRGLLKGEVSEGDQYTAINYTITQKGKTELKRATR